MKIKTKMHYWNALSGRFVCGKSMVAKNPHPFTANPNDKQINCEKCLKRIKNETRY